MTRHDQCHFVGGLKGRLVPAGEGLAGVVGLELGGGDGVAHTVVVGVGRTVKTVQLVVQDSRKGDGGHGRSRGECGVEGKGGGFVLVVIGRCTRDVALATDGHRGSADFEFLGVQGEGRNRLVDVEVNVDTSVEREHLEVGGQVNLVVRRNNGTRQAVRVGGHSAKSYGNLVA